MNNNLLYLRIKADLLQKMKTMIPDERLPSRNELIKEYNVTRTTIDRAISELIGEGYLYSKDGSGTYVLEKVVQASSQNNGEAINWGVVLPNIMYDIYPGILRGVEDIANGYGRSTIICNTDDDIEKQASYIHKLIDSNIDGIVIVPAVSEENDLIPFKRLQEKNIPFIFCSRGVVGIEAPKVTSNNFYGGYIATKHLIKCGFRRIAYISHAMYSVPIERYQGYISALAEANIELNEDYVIFEPTDVARRGYESAIKLLKSDSPVDAIFCYNDSTARGAYDAVTEAGFKVGEDIGLVGYDNTGICESLPVKLTSVKFNAYEIGLKAAELLISITKGGQKIPKNKMIILQPELVVRDSCGCSKKNI